MLWSLLVLLLLAEHPTATAGLRFIAIPKTGGSPALDLMAVAAKLQSRCFGGSCLHEGCHQGRRLYGVAWQVL